MVCAICACSVSAERKDGKADGGEEGVDVAFMLNREKGDEANVHKPFSLDNQSGVFTRSLFGLLNKKATVFVHCGLLGVSVRM